MCLWYRFRVSVAFCLLAAGVQAGCGGKRSGLQLPDGAELFAQRQGGVAFIAPQDGTLLIVDQAQGKVVFTTAMKFGEKVFFNPDKNTIYFNATLAKDGGLEARHVYQFYFVKG